ncbi:MAG: DNA-formamidopyrimidine glycosylase family protein, partial [Chthoniobacterales bacterium]
MPELAEVEYARKRWDAGIGANIIAVELHATKRVFRGTDTRELKRQLIGRRLLSSAARGKQMLFRFAGHNSLGIHLGMSGSMRTEPPDFRAAKHDH